MAWVCVNSFGTELIFETEPHKVVSSWRDDYGCCKCLELPNGNIQKEVIGIMVSNDIELRMIAAQITMKASVGAEDLCSRYSSVSRMLGNMFNDVYYILQDVRYRYKYK